VTGFLASVMFVANPAQAANLVVNGDFNTGDFTGWTQSGNTALSDIVNNSSAYNGTYYYRSGAQDSLGYISQTLTTVAGNQYDLSYVLRIGGNINQFQVLIDGNSISALNLVNVASQSSYSPYSYSFAASSSSTTLTFGFQNNPSYTRLDNVSVTDSASAVPEPLTILGAMTAAGFGAGFKRKLAKSKKDQEDA